MKRILSLLAIFTVCVCVFAQQTLPTRDGAAQIENGSGTLKLSVSTAGVGTITPSGTDLIIAGELKPTTVLGTAYGGSGASTVTGTGAAVRSTAPTLTNLTVVTGGTIAVTNLSATSSFAVGGGSSILAILSAAAELDFGSISTNTTADLTITVTGAGTNSVVLLGLPAASDTNLVFNGFVSATNTVTVRAGNISLTDVDPASGSFRATVIQY
jgi:hypothetical protein